MLFTRHGSETRAFTKPEASHGSWCFLLLLVQQSLKANQLLWLPSATLKFYSTHDIFPFHILLTLYLHLVPHVLLLGSGENEGTGTVMAARYRVYLLTCLHHRWHSKDMT